MSKQKLMIKYALMFIGTFYKWGGDDPSGFDCSGFCIEVGKAVGLFPRKYDNTANRIYNQFKNKEVKVPTMGCFIFWSNKNNRIIHIELCINTWQTIGASGGCSKTLTHEDAIRDNAYIKVRPIREGYSHIVNPFK